MTWYKVYIVGILMLFPASSLGADGAAVLFEDAPIEAGTHQRDNRSVPEISTEPITEAQVGVEYNYKVRARGNPKPSFSLEAAPAGMTITSNSGVINWTPDAPGSFEVEVIAHNIFGSDRQAFTIVVATPLSAPVITSAPLLQAIEGEAYQYQLAASGNPPPVFTLSAAPAGMVLDAATGLVEWTPDSPGAYSVTVSAENIIGTDIQQFSLEVLQAQVAPAIHSEPVLTGLVGIPYQYEISASGYPAAAFSVVEGPAGMVVDSLSGLLTWMPDAAGVYAVSVKAENVIGADAQDFTLTIGQELTEPSITSTPIKDAFLDQTYLYRVEAAANPPATFLLLSGPQDMTLNPETGEISWMPPDVGAYDIAIEASNALGSVTQTYTLVVTSAYTAPSITSIPVTQALVGLAYTYDVNAAGNPMPVYELLEAPDGMAIDSSSGVISWMPEAAGAFDVSVQARNEVGSFLQQFNLLVGVQGSAPQVQLQPIRFLGDYAFSLIAIANPNSSPTRVTFEYGINAVDEFQISATPAVLEGLTNQEAVAQLTELEAGQTYMYRAVAENNVGRVESPVLTFTTYPAVYQVGVVQQFSGKIDSLGYRLFSVPGAIDLDVAETLEGALEQDWGVYRDNGQPADYFEPYDASEAFRFKPGRGFWILSRAAWTVPEQTVSTVALDANGHFELALQPGWNIIASPFTEEIAWSQVRDASGSVPATAKLWGFGGTYQEVTVMAPYQAYYYFNDGPAGTRLSIPFPGLAAETLSQTASKAVPLEAKPASSAEPMLTLEATLFDTLHAKAEFLISSRADEGKDFLDQYTPRRSFSGLHLAIEPDFEAPYGNFSLEARPPSSAGRVYTLVLSASAGEQVTLRASGLDDFEGEQVYLVEKETGAFHDLKANNAVRFYLTGNQSRAHLVIGSQAFVDGQRAALAPADFVLQQNYPNPFSAATTIAFSLPAAEHVDMRIYNVLGQEVQQLVNNVMPAGFQQLVWDGNAAGGASLPAGTYFLRMETALGKSLVRSLTKVR